MELNLHLHLLVRSPIAYAFSHRAQTYLLTYLLSCESYLAGWRLLTEFGRPAELAERASTNEKCLNNARAESQSVLMAGSCCVSLTLTTSRGRNYLLHFSSFQFSSFIRNFKRTSETAKSFYKLDHSNATAIASATATATATVRALSQLCLKLAGINRAADNTAPPDLFETRIYKGEFVLRARRTDAFSVTRIQISLPAWSATIASRSPSSRPGGYFSAPAKVEVGSVEALPARSSNGAKHG